MQERCEGLGAWMEELLKLSGTDGFVGYPRCHYAAFGKTVGDFVNEWFFGGTAGEKKRVACFGVGKALVDYPGTGLDLCAAQIGL